MPQLALWHPSAFGDFREKNTETHVALRGNFSSPVSATDPVKSSKDAANLVACTQKDFLVGGCGFFVSDVVSGGLLAKWRTTLAHFTWPWDQTVRW